jgi:hypothetical protein
VMGLLERVITKKAVVIQAHLIPGRSPFMAIA